MVSETRRGRRSHAGGPFLRSILIREHIDPFPTPHMSAMSPIHIPILRLYFYMTRARACPRFSPQGMHEALLREVGIDPAQVNERQ